MGRISTPTDTVPPAAQPAEPEPPAGRGRHRALATYLGAVVSLLAVAGVVWWAAHQEPPRLPQTMGEWAAVIGAVALYALATLTRGIRWRRLLEDEGGTPSARDTQELNVIGYMGNNLLPARAGDAVRVVLMTPRAGGIPMRSVVGTLLAERLLDIAVILTLFVVVGYGLLGEAGGGDVGWIVLATAVLAAVATIAVILIRRNERMHAFVAPILSSTLQLRGRHGLTLLGITVVIWGLEAGVWMSTGAAAGFPMDPIEGCYIVALASVFALIPSGPGYAGTQDAAAVTGILALGGTHSQAVTYLILVRFVIAVPITVVGLALMATHYGGLRRLRPAR